MRNLHWNVYRYDFNSREIKIWDMFQHVSFNDDVSKLLKKKLNRDEFAEKLRSAAAYYFWSRCEYEVVVTSWPPHITPGEFRRLTLEENCRYNINLEEGIKIDIYQQLDLNWERFVDYVFGVKA